EVVTQRQRAHFDGAAVVASLRDCEVAIVGGADADNGRASCVPRGAWRREHCESQRRASYLYHSHLGFTSHAKGYGGADCATIHVSERLIALRRTASGAPTRNRDKNAGLFAAQRALGEASGKRHTRTQRSAMSRGQMEYGAKS